MDLEDRGELFLSLCSRERSSLGGIVFFPWGKENNGLGRADIFWGKVYSSQERIASFPREEGEQLPGVGRPPDAWLLGELLPSEEGWTVAGGELLPSPGGRWAIAIVDRIPGAWLWGELLPPKGGWTVAGGELLPSLGGRWALARMGWLPITWLLAWGRLVPSGRRWLLVRGELLPSLGGRKAMAGVGLQGAWCLPVYWISYVICSIRYGYIAFLFGH